MRASESNDSPILSSNKSKMKDNSGARGATPPNFNISNDVENDDRPRNSDVSINETSVTSQNSTNGKPRETFNPKLTRISSRTSSRSPSRHFRYFLAVRRPPLEVREF